ncbi:hypothetical protein FRB97_000311 [Tulasnella sp. 331]|nr:hypothetical protein FRB97_000311 [Tulasnella sp. 331]
MGGGPDNKVREASPMDIDAADVAARFPHVDHLPPPPPAIGDDMMRYQGPSVLQTPSGPGRTYNQTDRGTFNSFSASMMPQTPTNEPGAATTFPGITPPPISPEHYIFTPSAGTYVPISLTATMSSTLALASQNPDTQQQTSPSPTAQAFPPPAYDSAIQIRSREQIARILVSHASTIRRSRQRLGTIGFPDCRVAYQDGKVREGPSPADQEDPAPQSQVWNHIPSSRQAPGKLSGRMSNPVNSFSAAIPPVFPAAVLTPISNNDWSTSNGLL